MPSPSESPSPREYVDLQIQLRLARASSADGLQTTHDVVATIDGSGSWPAVCTIDYAALAQVDQVPRDYGAALGAMLFRPAIMNAFQQARGLRDRPVRVRLWLETGPDGERQHQHGIRWERAFVTLNGTDWPLAITPTLPFSRYVPAQAVDPDPSNDSTFRLLFVFANPENLLPGQTPVDVEADLSALLDQIKPLALGQRFHLSVMPGRTELSAALRETLKSVQADIIDGPSRLETIGRAVRACHGLHIVAHGTMNPETGRGALLLEDEHGGRAFVFDNDLYPWMHADLRFVVLQSCQSAAPTPPEGPPFVGIGPRLVQLGVPAVVAMQDFVAMEDARFFAASFYRSLMREGYVDVAVNEGRQAIFQKGSRDNFSIPVLFMRSKTGLLWRPDPLRNAVRARLADLGPQTAEPLPMRAIQSLHHKLDYDEVVGPSGGLFDMPAKLVELTAAQGALVLFLGSPGMANGSTLRWTFREAARRFLEEDPSAPAPVLLALGDIVDARSVSGAIDRNLAKWADSVPAARDAWADRPLLVIIEGDEEIGEQALRDGLRLLKDFRSTSSHRVILTLDEDARDVWDQDIVHTSLLVARPMDFERVCQYLKRLKTPASTRLHDVLEQRRCRDLAVRWLLERMMALSERNVTFDSRATLLRQIANECLTSIPMGGVPRSCADRALGQVAWQMQWGRQPVIGGDEFYTVLATARGNREFRLGDLKDTLIRSGILAAVGEDGVRFRYQSLQAYYAAQHLATLPDKRRLLEDITASLGRLARARWWEKTLITLAGLEAGTSEGILSAILAGSTLVEGEQVYLATRCYVDIREKSKAPAGLVNQIADALTWRSHPENLRPYADRKRAASALAELRHPSAVAHLVSLACERIATGWGSEKRFEFSGIRLVAVNGLLLMQQETTDYVRQQRPALAAVLNAWWTAYEKSTLEDLIGELHRNDPATSPIAAFALGYFDTPEARATLLEAFGSDSTDGDVGWAVTDTLAMLDPAWVASAVIEPRLGLFEDPRVPYLVGRIGLAAAETAQRKYLSECFQKGIPAVQARALRALGTLQDVSIRELCEAVVSENWDWARAHGMNLPAVLDEEDRSRLRNAAMEALREVGDGSSIEKLREVRAAGNMTITLRQLSFDVAEDIYWRKTGGLANEGFDPRGGV